MKRHLSEEDSLKYYKARKAAKAFANKAGGRSATSREKRLFKESDDTLTPNQLKWTDKVSFEMSEGWISPYCIEHLDKDRKYNLSYRKGLFTFQRGIPYGPKQDITLNVEDFFKLEDDEQE